MTQHTHNPSGQKSISKLYAGIILVILTIIYAFNFIDRQIIGVLSPIIQADLELSNTQMGLLKGIIFAIFYTVIGIPIAWLADRYNRVNIVTLSLIIWSAFTALTGKATNFLTIGLARMGVGIGEAGGSPPSHSVISDLYPKEKRSTALAFYSLGIPLGQAFAYFIAGYMLCPTGTICTVNTGLDWRQLLISLGITGVVLAIIARIVIREPQRGFQELKSQEDALIEAGGVGEINDNALTEKASFSVSITTLFKIKSWVAMAFGIAMASFTAYAIALTQMDYLLPYNNGFDEPKSWETITYVIAILFITAYGAGTYLGGALTDKLAKKSIRYYGIVPAVTVFLSLPMALLMFWLPSVTLFLAFAAPYMFFIGMYLGPSFAIAQTLAPIHMRAMSTALFFLILNLIALGFGPTTVGILADIFKPAHGQIHALRLGITISCLGLVISTLCFLYAAKHLPKDWEAAQARNSGQKPEG